MARILLHVNTERSWRGGESQTLALARGLQSRGFHCLMAVQPDGALHARSRAEGLSCVPLPMRGECDLRAARRLADLMRAERVDLLHYHTAHAITLGTLASLIAGRRLTVASRRVSFPLRGGALGRLKYHYRVDRVVAVSEAIRRGLIRRGLDPRKVVTVHSGIDPERFAAGDPRRLRNSLPAPGDRWERDTILVGTVGHLAAHKGFDRFLQAAALAARELPQVRFVIVGRGEERDALTRLAGRLGLADRIVFTGFRDDMPDVFAGLDLFVLASTSGEGSPAVLKEAMAAGVPLVAAGLDGVEEIVEDGRHGLVTPLDNAPAMARSIVLLAQDRHLGHRLAAEARGRVREFTIDRMVAGTEAIYRSLGGAGWVG
jgi:glycosyltransferase involved in cell wall biosynthesis